MQRISKSTRYLGLAIFIVGGNFLFINASSNSSLPAQAKNVAAATTAVDSWAKGRLLVQGRAGVADGDVHRLLQTHGGKPTGKISGIDVHIFQLPENANEKAVAALLAHHPLLKFAEVDGQLKLSNVTNDPDAVNEWHLGTIGASTAWNYANGSGVTIAILDSGVDGTHPDLVANLVPGYNMVDNNTNTADVQGHGTMVAGTAAAVGNNGIGAAGVAYAANIMPMRVADSAGYAYYSAISSALTWAADHGAKVANISFAGVHASSSIISAANYLKGKGGVTVAAAGNSGVLDSTPSTDAMISVSATDGSDNRTSWSSFGPYVDVAAPGAGIFTTTNGGGYGAPSGTSFSSPLTAGIIALMMSANPRLSPTQLANLLTSTARDLGDVGWDQYYGYGRVDAAAAVAAAVSTITSDTQAPTVSIVSPAGGAIARGTISVDVSASDNVGVSKVALYAGGRLLSLDNLPPYSFAVDTTLFSEGNLSLQAKAYDNSGNVSSTSLVNIVVDNIVDTIAPIVTISNPVNGSVVRGNVSVTVSASDNEQVSSLVLYVDNNQVASSSIGSVNYTWNTRKAAAGVHTLKAVAKDASGNIGTSTIQVSK